MGIWLVVDGLSTDGNEIILSLLMLYLVWPVGWGVELGFNSVFGRVFAWFRPCLLLGIVHFFVFGGVSWSVVIWEGKGLGW